MVYVDNDLWGRCTTTTASASWPNTIDALPSGSYVVISHFCDPETSPELSELARRLEQIFLRSPMGSGVFRTRAEIEGMFPGLELVEPGLIQCANWAARRPTVQQAPGARAALHGRSGRAQTLNSFPGSPLKRPLLKAWADELACKPDQVRVE